MENRELIQLAKKAMQNAYCPYSAFQVGAALLSKDGRVFLGCNVENASYGASNCAERTAIFKAISEGIREFEKIAIVSSSHEATFPCGICRQVLVEHMPDGVLLFENEHGEILEFTMSQILPFSFTKNDLK